MTSGGDAAHRLLVHKTEFQTDESGIGGVSIQAIYTELVADTARNAQIVADVTAAFRAGRTCLVLSSRVDHVDALARALRASIEPVHVLHGRMPRLERAETRAALAAASKSPFVLVAIDKIAGEGLDLPALDTLFLAVPISFKGRVVQQLGRVTRGGDGASVVHDYRDAQVLMLDQMHLKRSRVMQKQGFRVDALPAAPDA
ncbi:DEAD/DEAH box helicase [Rathayibacter soli]|uniref:DEAD/DEAH box helicase n=1 Tax=Rathayibacter soli TaxID=3144168 RepID=UPI003907F78D